MANTNPYTITDNGQSVVGNGVTVTIDDINDKLDAETRIDNIEQGCSCDGYSNRSATFIHSGDKWRLKMCTVCGGVWGWHDARADYL